MEKVKDMLIDLQDNVWYAFDHGFDLKETIAYVKERMSFVDEADIEEMYLDLKDEF